MFRKAVEHFKCSDLGWNNFPVDMLCTVILRFPLADREELQSLWTQERDEIQRMMEDPLLGCMNDWVQYELDMKLVVGTPKHVNGEQDFDYSFLVSVTVLNATAYNLLRAHHNRAYQNINALIVVPVLSVKVSSKSWLNHFGPVIPVETLDDGK